MHKVNHPIPNKNLDPWIHIRKHFRNQAVFICISLKWYNECTLFFTLTLFRKSHQYLFFKEFSNDVLPLCCFLKRNSLTQLRFRDNIFVTALSRVNVSKHVCWVFIIYSSLKYESELLPRLSVYVITSCVFVMNFSLSTAHSHPLPGRLGPRLTMTAPSR